MSDNENRAVVNIPHPEKVKIVQIVSKWDRFLEGPGSTRRALIAVNVSPDFADKFGNFNGDADIVAWNMVNKLIDQDALPVGEGQPGVRALGALLRYMLEHVIQSPEDRRFLATTIVKYSLVKDPVYLNELRRTYDVDPEVLRKPPQVKSQAPDVDIAEEDQDRLEQIINSEDNFLDVYYLLGAFYSASAVGLIEMPKGEPLGTGFLVGPNLLLTNFHVLEDKEFLKSAVVRFNYVEGARGGTPDAEYFEMDPDYYFSSPDTQLDYVLVRLKDQPLKLMDSTGITDDTAFLDMIRENKHRGYLRLSDQPVFNKARVNIIQHPQGAPKKVVMTQNRVVAVIRENHRIQYLADTMDGSSGSPVLNQNWEVVAIHHSSGSWPPENLNNTLARALRGHMKINEGIQISAIRGDLRAQGVNI